ncbi:hypothetical protein HJG60_010616 [Phyllostomus discolor]|uniref:Uncharacterized protein n=1 Tax=Phyllostomus discolor TaxID=89673 RepID=A0A834ARN7_9CHIR|nr:hypothetical protein HJG60_010616 [Phyllostomus discolor]
MGGPCHFPLFVSRPAVLKRVSVNLLGQERSRIRVLGGWVHWGANGQDASLCHSRQPLPSGLDTWVDPDSAAYDPEHVTYSHCSSISPSINGNNDNATPGVFFKEFNELISVKYFEQCVSP